MSFAVERVAVGYTRLLVQTRLSYQPSGRVNPAWLRPAHNVMQATQLRNLAARVEERLPANDWRDVLSGLAYYSAQAGALDAAQAYARKLVELDPENPEYAQMAARLAGRPAR